MKKIGLRAANSILDRTEEALTAEVFEESEMIDVNSNEHITRSISRCLTLCKTKEQRL